MFGIRELKENIAGFTQWTKDAIWDLKQGRQQQYAEIARVSEQLLRLSKMVSQVIDRQSAAERTIGLHSEHMMELDKRISELEIAQRAGAVVAAPITERLAKSRKVALKYSRTSSEARANKVLDTDADAREIRRRANILGIDKRVIECALAAGVVEYARNGRYDEIDIRASLHVNNPAAKYSVQIKAKHKHTPSFETEQKQARGITDAHRFVDVCRNHFNKTVPTGLGHA